MAGKKNNKAVSDEQIIAAILQHGTIKEAAAAAGVSTRTIYDRMQDREFRALYMSAKNDVLRRAVLHLNSTLSAAIDAIKDIMTDEDVNPATRLQAAQTILNNAGKYSETLQKNERAATSEANNPFEEMIFNSIL